MLFLNHGSFGACPEPVLAEQSRWRARMERQPVSFFARELPSALASARESLAAFVGADPEGLAFVPNATTGVNTVLRSLALSPGDELLLLDHEYNACRNAAEAVARATGARVVVAALPFPCAGPEEVEAVVLAAMSPRTRLLLVDHVTSPTALVLPIDRLVPLVQDRGIDVLVDGAHAPGMVPLALDALSPAYYTGNLHKWVCAPKGAALLWVREDRRERVRPLVTSHGANAPLDGRTRFRLEHDWTGTSDPSAYLTVPAALQFLEGAHPEGVRGLMARNHLLALQARDVLCAMFGVAPPCPDSMIGSMATLPLPDGAPSAYASPLDTDPLQDALLDRYGIEVPIVCWPHPRSRMVRISAQIYNEIHDFECLGEALRALLEAERLSSSASPEGGR